MKKRKEIAMRRSFNFNRYDQDDNRKGSDLSLLAKRIKIFAPLGKRTHLALRGACNANVAAMQDEPVVRDRHLIGWNEFH